MFMIALTGGIEEPSFITFKNLKELKENEFYTNVDNYVNRDMGHRVDVVEFTEHGPAILESFTD